MHTPYIPNLMSHWLLMCSPSVSIWLRISISLITLNILVSLITLADLPIMIRIRVALSSCLLLLNLVVSYTLNVHLAWLIESSWLSIISLLIPILWWVSHTISTAIDKFSGYSAVPIIHFVTVAVDTNLNFASIWRYIVLVSIYCQVNFWIFTDYSVAIPHNITLKVATAHNYFVIITHDVHFNGFSIESMSGVVCH